LYLARIYGKGNTLYTIKHGIQRMRNIKEGEKWRGETLRNGKRKMQKEKEEKKKRRKSRMKGHLIIITPHTHTHTHTLNP